MISQRFLAWVLVGAIAGASGCAAEDEYDTSTDDKSDTLRPERGIDVFFVHADQLKDGTPLVDATLRVGDNYNGHYGIVYLDERTVEVTIPRIVVEADDGQTALIAIGPVTDDEGLFGTSDQTVFGLDVASAGDLDNARPLRAGDQIGESDWYLNDYLGIEIQPTEGTSTIRVRPPVLFGSLEAVETLGSYNWEMLGVATDATHLHYVVRPFTRKADILDGTFEFDLIVR